MVSFDVTELPESDHVTEGESAPDFVRPLVNRDFWEDVSLSSLTTDHPVLLFAFPMDGTGQAKGTWIDIRNRGWGGKDLTVAGVSISTPYEHKTLLDRHDLPYRLFSDPGAGVADEYGIVHDYHGMAGISGHRPAFYLIDERLQVQFAWVASRWPADYPFDAVEEAISAL